MDHHQAVGQGIGLVELVGGEQDAAAAIHEAPDVLPERAARLDVEAGGRLVQEEQLRIAAQGQCEQNPLALATRQLAEQPVLEPAQSGRGYGFRQGQGRRVVTREQLDVLAHPQHFRRTRPLQHGPAAEPNLAPPRTLAEQGNLSGAGGGQAEQQADQRGLPGSVRAEQGHQLATADRQIDSAERPNRSVLLHDAPRFCDHRLSHAFHVEATPALPVVPEVSPVR